jgi:hypothetical protein
MTYVCVTYIFVPYTKYLLKHVPHIYAIICKKITKIYKIIHNNNSTIII